MKEFVIKSELSDRENILRLIEHVKNVERENGLSDKEINQKYTHKDCRCLVSIINRCFPNIKPVMFLLDEEDVHFVAMLESEFKNGEKKTTYFDINGEKSFSDVCLFMFENFGRTGIIMSKETTSDFISNDISQQVFDSIQEENVGIEKQ